MADGKKGKGAKIPRLRLRREKRCVLWGKEAGILLANLWVSHDCRQHTPALMDIF
ncbi:MAG: hypothetical protein IKH84_03735 [Ottowia sp.]|nr:hypothetical protein [Ottowia sp.]